MVNTLRPRGIFGLIRARGPLSVVIYTAARDGRLVWRNTGAFAVLEPPHNARFSGRPRGLLHLVDRRWEFLLFAGPPAVLLLSALSAFALRQWWPTLLWVALALPLLALLHVAVLVPAMLGTVVVRWILGLPIRGRPDWWTVEEMRFLYWSMPLCHCADPVRAPALLGQVTQQLRDLVRAQVARAVEDLGARTKTVEVNESLLCLLSGTTTGTMRDAITAATADSAAGREAGVTFLTTGSRPKARSPKVTDSGSGLALYMLGVTAVVGAEALQVAEWERDACAADCAGRPASYGTALRWLAWRLVADTPAGLVPVTTQAWVLGWLNTVMGFMIVPLLLVTVWRARTAYRERVASFTRRMGPVFDTSNVLIMVATPEEHQAVLKAVTDVTGATPERLNLDHHTAFALGVVSRARVLLAQTRPGSTDPGGATLTAQSLIDQLDPDYLLLTGISFGLRKGEQALGDILVCTQLRVMDHKKIIEPVPGTPVEIMRGNRVSPSVTLLDRCQNARLAQDGPKVHFGPLLSGNVLLNSSTARKRMIEAEPDAIGGEMEGLGVYAAAAKGKVDWIVVKAICDWGMGKTDRWHPVAARNAAEFVLDVISNGGLDRPPRRL
ncbi:5'-methylthioadenosine/S-adenosylhomocysteine nucleosidase family protein [Streptosporangium sp. NPDC004631]